MGEGLKRAFAAARATRKHKADMASEQLFDVIEVQFRAPHAERVMATGLTERNAEAVIKMAVYRRGVEHCYYTSRPSGTPKEQTPDTQGSDA